ncbi:uncharacterized protein EKO05_0003872 [Ascochyta rabiei]|uniref:uncharacterized protein n=1 Tax=Didymella rabiei TaxID=5454 RepID=UPI0018FF8EEB|nr:uncharacterized protein EKO05_0003872 [Ascochyta rabiei]UPX13362.1 hypothetical protein EKO05_0003872 [Ascochyta rabiei]
MPSKACYLTYPKRSEFINDERYEEELVCYDSVFARDMQEGQEFKHGFGCGISVLLSCRQIYHEFAGVLYGSNTFVITRALHCHDQNDYQHLHYPWQCSQFDYAPLWLAGLGCQVDLLHKVYIDVDAICPRDCDVFEFTVFDMLPIIRIIWKHPWLTKKLEFFRSGRKNKEHAKLTSAREAGEHSEQRAILLNNWLNLLCTQDVLRLKQYIPFKMHLEHIWVPILQEQDSASDVSVQFCNIPTIKRYYIVNSGRGLTACEERPNFRIEHLLNEPVLARNIVEHAAHGQPGVVFDLTRPTFSGLDVSLLHLDRMFDAKYNLAEIFAQANDVTLRARSTSVESNFDHFIALQELRSNAQFREIVYAHREDSSPLTIELECDMSTKSSLPELEINIEGLVGFLCDTPNTALRISLNCLRDGRVYSECISVDTICLCLSIYVLLSDLLESWSIPLSHKWTADITALVIDGRGILKSATCCTDKGLYESTIENKFAHLSKEEMYHYGYMTAASHDRDYRYLCKRALRPHSGQVLECLLKLHYEYWADWKNVRPLPTTL